MGETDNSSFSRARKRRKSREFLQDGKEEEAEEAARVVKNRDAAFSPVLATTKECQFLPPLAQSQFSLHLLRVALGGRRRAAGTGRKRNTMGRGGGKLDHSGAKGKVGGIFAFSLFPLSSCPPAAE